MKTKWLSLLLTGALALSILSGCSQEIARSTEAMKQELDAKGYYPTPIKSDIQGAEEGTKTLLANMDYYNGMNENDICLRMGKKDASLEEYLDFTVAQVQEPTEEEKKAIEDSLERIAQKLHDAGYNYPLSDQVKFIITTMVEESGASAYTHGEEIYLQKDFVDMGASKNREAQAYFDETMAHEIFHVLSRNLPDFRENMYRVIGFTVDEEEPAFSDKVRKQILSNPDVEKYDCHATFTINGKKTDGVVVTYMEGDYKEGDTFFKVAKPGIVPIDNPTRIIPIDQVSDFSEVMGENTDYVIAAEECLADNFSYAINYGVDGGYPNPEIIEAIRDYLATGKETVQVTGEAKADEGQEDKAQDGNKKDDAELAREVIKGKWGNGPERVRMLTEAGYDAAAVQREVNRLLK